MFNLASAFIGFEGAVAFNDFAAKYSNIVTVENILDEGKIALTSEFTINDHCALIEKMESNETFKNLMSDEQVQNLSDYFVTLPSEAAMKLWTVLGSEGNNLDNTIALHQASSADGVSVSGYLVELLTGQSVEE